MKRGDQVKKSRIEYVVFGFTFKTMKHIECLPYSFIHYDNRRGAVFNLGACAVEGWLSPTEEELVDSALFIRNWRAV